jgi:hypothetical protein
MASNAQILLISGIPASGKTSFGNWLRDNRGFLHVDLEAADCLKSTGLPPFWSEKERIADLDSGRLRDFVRHLKSLGGDAALSWGFNTDLIDFVRELTTFGVTAWWFEADRLAARQRYVARGTVLRNGVYMRGTPDTNLFDRYVASVSSNWSRIAPIFGERVIRTLSSDGRFLDPVSICDRIKAQRASAA